MHWGINVRCSALNCLILGQNLPTLSRCNLPAFRAHVEGIEAG